MATITYDAAGAGFAPWTSTYDSSGTVAKRIYGGTLIFYAQNTDGTNTNVYCTGGSGASPTTITGWEHVDYLNGIQTLIHADAGMSAAAFVEALYGPRPSTAKAMAALLAGNDDITGSAAKDVTRCSGTSRSTGSSRSATPASARASCSSFSIRRASWRSPSTIASA